MTDSQRALDKGIEYISLNRNREAITILTPLINDPNPDIAYMAHVQLSRAMVDLGHFDDAASVARAGIALSPQQWQAYLMGGISERKRNDNDAALILLEDAARLAPGEPSCFIILAELYSDTGRSDDGLAAAQHALDLAPDLAAAHHAFGYVLHDSDPAQAEKAYNDALSADPEYLPSQISLAVLSYAKGDIEQGLKESMSAVALDPTRRATVELIETQIRRRVGLLMLGMAAVTPAFIGAVSARQPGAPITSFFVFGGGFIWSGVAEYRKIRSAVGPAAPRIIRSVFSHNRLALAWMATVPISWIAGLVFSILFVVNPDIDTGVGVAACVLPLVVAMILWILEWLVFLRRNRATRHSLD